MRLHKSIYRFFVRAVTFNNECPSNVGKVQIVVKLGGSPDFSDFYTSMIGWSDIDIVWLLPIDEVEFYIFKECWLVTFDSEMIMALTR